MRLRLEMAATGANPLPVHIVAGRTDFIVAGRPPVGAKNLIRI
jgi:hypothetical protein